MMRGFSYPVVLQKDEAGRVLVLFPDLPEAVTDGADEAEALAEAVDCLSEALASRIVDGEEIPVATTGDHWVSPDPTIALKAALYSAMCWREMTVADLAELIEIDWHQAARLIDPKRSSKLTSLAIALRALGCTIEISVADNARIARAEELLGRVGYRPAISGADRSVGEPIDASPRRKRRGATSAG